MKTSTAPGDDAGHGDGNDDAPQGRQRTGAEVGGGFEQRGVEPLQSGVHGQDEEGEEIVDEAGEHRAFVVEQRERAAREMHGLEQSVHETGVAEDEEPGVSADEEAGPEGQKDELEPERFALPRPGDEEGEGEAEDHRERGGEGGDPDGAPEDGEIERVCKAGEIFESPGRFNTAVFATGEKAVGADDAERGGEEERHPQAGREKEEAAEGHEKRISSAGFQWSQTASPSRK